MSSHSMTRSLGSSGCTGGYTTLWGICHKNIHLLLCKIATCLLCQGMETYWVSSEGRGRAQLRTKWHLSCFGKALEGHWYVWTQMPEWRSFSQALTTYSSGKGFLVPSVMSCIPSGSSSRLARKRPAGRDLVQLCPAEYPTPHHNDASVTLVLLIQVT